LGAGNSLAHQLVTGLLTPNASFIQATGTMLFAAAAGVSLFPLQRRIGTADRIIVYSAGRVIQTGRPENVFGSKDHSQVSNLLDIGKF